MLGIAFPCLDGWFLLVIVYLVIPLSVSYNNYVYLLTYHHKFTIIFLLVTLFITVVVINIYSYVNMNISILFNYTISKRITKLNGKK
jgi:hypothetical protein